MFYSISSMSLMEQMHDSNKSPSAIFITVQVFYNTSNSYVVTESHVINVLFKFTLNSNYT